MAPPAVEVDEENSSSPHEEYETPAGESLADHETSPDLLVNPNADSDVKAYSDHSAPDQARTSSEPSLRKTTSETHVNGEVTIVTPKVSRRSPLSTPRIAATSASTVQVPTAAATPNSIKIEKEVASLKNVMKDASPEALHKLLRDEWRVFLYTPLEEDHVTYILRACLKNSTPTVVERGVKEVFSNPENRWLLINNTLRYVTPEQLIKQLPTQILSKTVDKAIMHATAPALIHRLPQNVLREVVAHQFDVMSARDLVNTLAQAGRLGYSVDDIVDEETEAVFPPDSPKGADTQSVDDVMSGVHYSQPQRHSPAVRDPSLVEQERNQAAEIQRSQQAFIQRQQQKQRQNYTQHPPPAPASGPALEASAVIGPCATCGFTSPTRVGQAYHEYKMPCKNTSKQPPANGWFAHCANCGQTFTQSGGLSYHNANRVCSSGKFADRSAPSVSQRPNLSTAPRASPKTSAILPPPRPTNNQIPRPPLHTPAQLTPQARAPGPEAVIQVVDPHARVNPSQLSAQKKAELDAQIAAEDLRYQKDLAEIAANDDLDDEGKEKRGISAKNLNATKKSQIRKKFGVSLRLREKDKITLRTAPLSSPTQISSASRPGPSYPSPHVQIPSHVSSPASRVSPINGPSSPAAGPSRPPAILPPQYAQQQNGSGSGSRRPHPRMSGFGISKTNNAILPQGYQNQDSHPNKRQRTSSVEQAQPRSPPKTDWVPPSALIQTPYGPLASGTLTGTALSMMEVSSKDAASKFPKKKVPIAGAQARWEQLQPQRNGERTAVRTAETTTTTSPGKVISNTVREAIEIDSSSDTDVAKQNGRGARVLEKILASRHISIPSTEDTESEDVSRRIPSGSARRGHFMARRGGRRS